jgi:hypothetical protein
MQHRLQHNFLVVVICVPHVANVVVGMLLIILIAIVLFVSVMVAPAVLLLLVVLIFMYVSVKITKKCNPM